MKILKRVLGIITMAGLALAMTSCCHWKNCNAKANNNGMEPGMNANLLHRPPLAYPATNCCSDELIADGSFESLSSGASFWDNVAIRQKAIEAFPAQPPNHPDNAPHSAGPWLVEKSEYDNGDAVGLIGFRSNGNPQFHDTPCGNLFVCLGMTNAVDGNGSHAAIFTTPTPSTLSEPIWTQLKAGSQYHLCFLQSALTDKSFGGEVIIELYKSFPPNDLVFSGDWTVNAGDGWTMQTTNILILADNFYTIKISSVTNKVAIIDGVSLRGPYKN